MYLTLSFPSPISLRYPTKSNYGTILSTDVDFGIDFGNGEPGGCNSDGQYGDGISGTVIDRNGAW